MKFDDYHISYGGYYIVYMVDVERVFRRNSEN